MPTGVLKIFFREKGFGIITADEGGADIFVHSCIYEHGEDKCAYIRNGAKLIYDAQWDPNARSWVATFCSGFVCDQVLDGLPDHDDLRKRRRQADGTWAQSSIGARARRAERRKDKQDEYQRNEIYGSSASFE